MGNPRQSESGDSEKDRVLIVMEIASLPRDKGQSASMTKEVERVKDVVLAQLEGYMDRLGKDGDRWDDNVVGIAMLGTEVSFVLPHDGSDGDGNGWKRYQDGRKQWFSLYGEKFLDFVNRAMER